ncbi:hypothetical protein T484DRAFT_1760430 [Baffinella frigidus]|nr:hypothetical protein T484DRAFT_1760430 [Cryptophyta sp. CCMP2293]
MAFCMSGWDVERLRYPAPAVKRLGAQGLLTRRAVPRLGRDGQQLRDPEASAELPQPLNAFHATFWRRGRLPLQEQARAGSRSRLQITDLCIEKQSALAARDKILRELSRALAAKDTVLLATGEELAAKDKVNAEKDGEIARLRRDNEAQMRRVLVAKGTYLLAMGKQPAAKDKELLTMGGKLLAKDQDRMAVGEAPAVKDKYFLLLLSMGKPPAAKVKNLLAMGGKLSPKDIHLLAMENSKLRPDQMAQTYPLSGQ